MKRLTRKPGDAPIELLLLRPVHDRALQRLEQDFSLLKAYDAPDAAAFVKAVGPRVRGIAAGAHAAIDRDLIDQLPRLEIIANFGAGCDSIDLAAARRRGIPVTNTPDVLTDDVADLAIALLIGTVRQLPAADRYLRRGSWAGRGPYPLTTSCGGRIAGILGLGRIGLAIAARLAPMGVAVHYHNRRPIADCPFPYHASPAALADAADFLIVSCPGGAATERIVGSDVLAALGPDGYLINVARGSVVDEGALVDALTHRRIRGAGLDVFSREPDVPAALIDRDDVFLLPHVGSATTQAREAMANLMVDNLVAHFSGQPLLTPVV
ncbi:MAG: 2-hydroxyacid dehydrogenase [Alphaproteobacteria bacterium]|nr:2-hydroxyacid dehydrogenase [Alphaproteobacteria bacterium]